MTTLIESGRSWVMALAVGVSLVTVSGAWAQSDMIKKEPTKKEDMKDGMMKDDATKGADKAMKQDGMLKDDAMKQGEMKSDAMEKKQ